MDIAVLAHDRQSSSTCPVPAVIMERGQSTAALYYAINAERANKRLGTAATKGRALISGSNAKPWRQKGTGRARAGSRKSPIWRGGGTVFGPQPRSYHISVPRKQRAVALCAALRQKITDRRLFVIDAIDIPEPKTALLNRTIHQYLALLDVPAREYRTVLLIIDDGDSASGRIRRAGKNIPYLTIQHYARLSLHTLFYRDYVFLSQAVITHIASALNALFHVPEALA